MTTNLETKNNQNCQKIELYGSPTTKELKKHSFRPVGGAERTAGAERTHGKAAAGTPVIQNLHVDKLRGATGEPDRPQNPGFQGREIKPQNL